MNMEDSNRKLVKVKSLFKKPIVNPCLFQDDVKRELKSIFQKDLQSLNLDKKVKAASASTYPFPHCVLQDFLCYDAEPAVKFVEQLCNDLLKFEFQPKSNDLYKFKQTNELMMKNDVDNKNGSELSYVSPYLKQFCSVLQTTMLPWLQDITGIQFNDDIDMFCAQYSSTDCLLCHDDELESRCIAYVYYLTSDWTIKDGGDLQLFDSTIIDGKSDIYDPHQVVKSIVPLSNSFVFFEVSPTSFHQVAEVLAKDKTRVSLTGWFHGPTISRPSRQPDVKPSLRGFIPSSTGPLILSGWINEAYLSISTQANIQEEFVDLSEIQLKDFLQIEKYEQLYEALRYLHENKEWKLCGPPNRSLYYQLNLPRLEHWNTNSSSDAGESTSTNHESSAEWESGGIPADCNEGKVDEEKLNKAEEVIRDFMRLLLSEEMFLYLANITGLSLHPMAVASESENDDSDDDVTPRKRQKLNNEKDEEPGLHSKCRYQVRRWEHGCHTLIRDADFERGESALDVKLFFCDSEWKEEHGGFTSYIASDEADDLLTVLPTKNCLALIYRDKEALRFVKHINHTAPGTYFDISAVYYE